ncbi:MAG: hypothetical protein AAB971_03125 [Patescibacteria group bacterium]
MNKGEVNPNNESRASGQLDLAVGEMAVGFAAYVAAFEVPLNSMWAVVGGAVAGAALVIDGVRRASKANRPPQE